jgi:MFS family permease
MASLWDFARRLRGELSQTFRSLSHRNFRIYSAGQLVSLIGSWMQSVALQWIAFDMTHSAVLLGLVGLFTNIPVLLLSLPAGALADRFDRRKVLIITQWIELALAATLTVLVVFGVLQVWMILALSVVAGICTAFEMPSRQSLVPELVQGQDLVNALSLNSVILNFTRMVGPALGAVLLTSFGEGVCFGLNAASFLAAIVTLGMLHLQPKTSAATTTSQSGYASMKEGVRIALGNSEIRNLFILTFFTAFFGFQFTILMPVFVKEVYHQTAQSLGLLTSATAVGSLAASLFFASRAKPETLKRILKFAAVGVSLSLLAFAASPTMLLSLPILAVTGIAFSLQFNSSNSLLQLAVDDAVRGRIMSLYSMILLGSAPFGSLLLGYVSDLYGAPLAVTISGLACGICSLFYVTRK